MGRRGAAGGLPRPRNPAYIRTVAEVHFYFDFDCPYSYLADTRLRVIASAAGAAVRYCAVDVEQVKRAAGNDGPALREIPAKRRYVEHDARRWARRYGVPYFVRERDAAQATLAMACIGDEDASRCVAAAFAALWARPPGSGEALEAIAAASRRPVEAVREAARSPAAAAGLAARCRAAAGRGVFGVPTFILGEALYWGNDRLELVEADLRRRPAAKGP